MKSYKEVSSKIAAAFYSDFRLALVLDPPQAKYVQMTYNQVFFRTVRILIAGVICMWMVLTSCLTIDYVVTHADEIALTLIKLHIY